jgi:ABC-type long-subunit fatty acid transport system fused permease/ATPase subunit
MMRAGGLVAEDVYRLWGLMIGISIAANIFGVILTQIVSAIVYRIRTNQDEKFIEDERDRLIDLRGTRIAYLTFSLGVLLSMLTMVLGRPPLVMFNLLIFSGLTAQILADLSRLAIYRRGF